MTSPEAKRKLTVVFVTDVAGYSRLMGDDPDATVKTLASYRDVFFSRIEGAGGRVVNAPGDSILAEFASVVDAVSTAVDIQRELAARNGELPESRRMHFRIGVNLGDVLVREGELFGDGVNIAARLEALADPGGICISRRVYDEVESRLDLDFDYLGEHTVKNIARPVRVYKVLLEPGQAPTRTERAVRKLARSWRKAALVAAGAVLVALVAVLAWNLYRQSVIESALAAFEKEAAFPLPDRPSIAVLAFDNLSGDPEQEYFSDGLSENIITRLAVISEMFIIARNSSFKYKGKAVDVRKVGRELGVRYVLEGSVQKAKGHIRITVQLIDAATGNHLWAESYDRELKDIFAVQDDITRRVVTELQVNLTMGERARIFAQATENAAAFDLYLRGNQSFLKFDREKNHQARKSFEQAIALDPNYAMAIAILGWTHMIDVFYRFSDDPAHSLNLAEEKAWHALDIDENMWMSHSLLSRVYIYKKEFERAIAHGRKTVAFRPNDAVPLALFASLLTFSGNIEEALPLVQRALRAHPFPEVFIIHIAGTVYYFAGDFAQSITHFQKSLKRRTKGPVARLSWQFLIAGYMELGREEEARAEMRKLLAVHPESSVRTVIKTTKRLPYKDFSFLDHQVKQLRAAGLPE